jgi:hypothetical protein
MAAALLLLAGLAAFALFLFRCPPNRRAGRKQQLFNPTAEDLTLQSADNLRLFSDAQIEEIEKQ